MNNNQKISLHYDNEILVAMLNLFTTLKHVESDSHMDLVQEGSKISFVEKENKDKVKFNFDYSDLETKIFNWMDKKRPEPLNLNETDSNLFSQCSHAAYYYLIETLPEDQLGTNMFIKLYKKYFLK